MESDGESGEWPRVCHGALAIRGSFAGTLGAGLKEMDVWIIGATRVETFRRKVKKNGAIRRIGFSSATEFPVQFAFGEGPTWRMRPCYGTRESGSLCGHRGKAFGIAFGRMW